MNRSSHFSVTAETRRPGHPEMLTELPELIDQMEAAPDLRVAVFAPGLLPGAAAGTRPTVKLVNWTSGDRTGLGIVTKAARPTDTPSAPRTSSRPYQH
ncbi:hypothetical protein GCM10010464_40960 [Pseudonocardia yunnanensis]|uniref:Uncharacterized protein n=1 Tax=Pseudonocardia yunnanensis TaxID=58107 RepID=A0ABW4F4D1_9PSEU